jgi:hypothetical protein
MNESIMDKLPYLLRKQTLKDEMPEFAEEREVFKRAQASARGETLSYEKIMVIICDTQLGLKTLNTAVDLTRQNASEIVVVLYTDIPQSMKDLVLNSGVKYKLVQKPTSATGDIMFMIRQEKVDLVVMPERFSQKIAGISAVTKQIVAESDSAALVIR